MRVLVSGYYGYGNLGDEALLSGMVDGLRGRDVEVWVLSRDPAATRRLHGVRSAHRYGALLSAIARCDAVVSGGGGLLQDGSSRRSLSYYLGVLRLARRLRKPGVVYAQSVGPLSATGRDRVARVLRSVPIAVRDSASRSLLRSMGLDATVVADPALLLPCPGRRVPEPAPDSEPPAPVLLVPRAGHAGLNDALVGAGRQLRAQGLPVAVLGLHEPEDDAEVARVATALGVQALRASTPADAMRHVAGSRYVLSVRLHGLIFAAACGVGFGGLVYDPKVAAFLSEARAPAFEPPVEPARLAATAAAAAPPDPHALSSLRQRARDGLDWLAQQLSGNTRGVQQSSS